MNATLASWLGLDLIEATSGSVQVSQFTPKESAKLLGRVNATPGETFSDVFDLEIITRDGTTIPVRILHSVRFGDDGRPGPSRTLVLREDLRQGGALNPGASDQRVSRFFNNAPIELSYI